MPKPLASCLCCTYGRPILLGEAVKCFLDQDYENIENQTASISKFGLGAIDVLIKPWK